MTPGEWVGIAGGVMSLAGPAVTWGMLRQKVMDLKEHVSNLATKESVGSIEGRVGALETDMREARDALAVIPVISEQIRGFRELVGRDTDEIRHGVRGVKAGQEQLSKLVTDLLAKDYAGPPAR